ncbi:16973_t:CDS:1, partial [Dentiscutata erythropus]
DGSRIEAILAEGSPKTRKRKCKRKFEVISLKKSGRMKVSKGRKALKR